MAQDLAILTSSPSLERYSNLIREMGKADYLRRVMEVTTEGDRKRIKGGDRISVI